MLERTTAPSAIKIHRKNDLVFGSSVPAVKTSHSPKCVARCAGAVPTVNGDAGPDEAAAPLRLGPAESVEQSVLIAPPLEAPKRRINYTILRWDQNTNSKTACCHWLEQGVLCLGH